VSVMEKINFGIVGIGRRGLGHLNTLKRFKNVEVKSVCDIDERKLREVSEKYSVKPYKDIDEMLRKEKLNAVAICTPTPLHVSQTVKCIENGLDVMLEKPISLRIDEVKYLLKKISELKQIVAVSFQSRYMRIVEIAKNNIDETLSMLDGYWYWTTPIIKWIRDRNFGGGQMVDQAIHLIDLYRFFAGEISEVYAYYTERGRDTDIDRREGFNNWSSYVTIFKFKNNVVGSISSTYALYPRIFRKGFEYPVLIDIVCREKLIRYIHGYKLKIYEKNETTKVFKEYGNATYKMYRKFIQSIMTRDDSILPTRYSDSYRTMMVSLAANQSAISGEKIRIEY